MIGEMLAAKKRTSFKRSRCRPCFDEKTREQAQVNHVTKYHIRGHVCRHRRTEAGRSPNKNTPLGINHRSPPPLCPTHLHVSPVVDENVLGLDVSVNDAIRVQVDEPLQHLPGVLAGHGVAEGAELPQEGVQRPRGDPLLEDAQPPLAVLELRAEVAHDMRVHQLVHHLFLGWAVRFRFGLPRVGRWIGPVGPCKRQRQQQRETQREGGVEKGWGPRAEVDGG